MNTAPPTYTAAQLACAAGMSKRALLGRLEAIPARGTVIVSGNPAPAWPLADLPYSLFEVIERARAVAGCRTSDDFISGAHAQWQPPIPLSEIADCSITKAAALRRALASAIERRNDPSISSGELEAIGLADFQKEFGYTVTGRHFRGLLRRTVDRDNFAENWNRLEIYLDGNPQRKADVSTPALTADPEYLPLVECLAGFKMFREPETYQEPTPREREDFWLKALKLFRPHFETGLDVKRARLDLVNFIWNSARWAARSRHALRVAFQFNFDGWKNSGFDDGWVRDLRFASKGIPIADAIPETYINFVAYHAAAFCGQRIAQARREINGMIAEDFGIENEFAELLLDQRPAARTEPRKPVTRADTAHSVKPSLLPPQSNPREMQPALDCGRAMAPLMEVNP